MTAAASRAVGPGVLDAINADPEGFSRMLGGSGFTQPAPYSSDGFRRYASGGAIDASSHGGDTHYNLPLAHRRNQSMGRPVCARCSRGARRIPGSSRRRRGEAPFSDERRGRLGARPALPYSLTSLRLSVREPLCFFVTCLQNSGTFVRVWEDFPCLIVQQQILAGKRDLLACVRRYGIARMARDLEIDPTAIYQWVRGSVSPRPDKAMLIIQLVSPLGRLRLVEIYAQRRIPWADSSSEFLGPVK